MRIKIIVLFTLATLAVAVAEQPYGIFSSGESPDKPLDLTGGSENQFADLYIVKTLSRPNPDPDDKDLPKSDQSTKEMMTRMMASTREMTRWWKDAVREVRYRAQGDAIDEFDGRKNDAEWKKMTSPDSSFFDEVRKVRYVRIDITYRLRSGKYNFDTRSYELQPWSEITPSRLLDADQHYFRQIPLAPDLAEKWTKEKGRLFSVNRLVGLGLRPAKPEPFATLKLTPIRYQFVSETSGIIAEVEESQTTPKLDSR